MAPVRTGVSHRGGPSGRCSGAYGGGIEQTGGELKVQGTFTITGGTGVFADMTGGGTISGVITCLEGRYATCAQLGVFSDAVFSLQGTFSDPTV